MAHQAKIKKGNEIHFLTNNNRVETIIKTYKPNDINEGEIETTNNKYSVAFIRQWEKFNFLEIHAPKNTHK